MVDHAKARIPQIMQEACRTNAVIKSVGMHEPTLEDVFLKFTGKKMRDVEGAGNAMNAMMIHRKR
jgi:ABC-2 type transport system ATP-binding protein